MLFRQSIKVLAFLVVAYTALYKTPLRILGLNVHIVLHFSVFLELLVPAFQLRLLPRFFL